MCGKAAKETTIVSAGVEVREWGVHGGRQERSKRDYYCERLRDKKKGGVRNRGGESKFRNRKGFAERFKWDYAVASISRLLKTLGLFCRILFVLQGSFAKETYNFKEPTSRSHFIPPWASSSPKKNGVSEKNKKEPPKLEGIEARKPIEIRGLRQKRGWIRLQKRL